MGQTLAQTRAAAQLYLDNPGTSAISAAEWRVLINAANRDVWRDLIEQQPSYFEVASRFTVAANTASFDLSGASYLNATPYKTVEVWRLQQNAAVSPNNLPVRLTPMPVSEYDMRLQAGIFGPGNPYNGVVRWYMLRGTTLMYLAPIPTASTVLDVRYIPTLADLTSADDSVEVLAGRADEFQDLVALRAAWLANAKRQGTNPVVQQLWLEGVARMKNAAEHRQMAEPRFVRRSSWGL